MLPLIIFAFIAGLVPGSFLFLAAWFAWTPLPMVLRMPLALFLAIPFGIVAVALSVDPEASWGFVLMLWLILGLTFAADRSTIVLGCMGVSVLWLLGSGFLLVSSLMDQHQVEELSTIGFVLVVLMCLAALEAPLRFFGYRLERLSPGASDTAFDLLTSKTIDQWINELDLQDGLDWNFAETMAFVSGRGIPLESQKMLVTNVFRALGKPTPSLGRVPRLKGMMGWFEWATTGVPGKQQFTIAQTLRWIVAASLLFAALRQVGVHSDWPALLITLVPSLIAISAATVLLGLGALQGHLRRTRWLMIGFSFILFMISAQWIVQSWSTSWIFNVTIPAVHQGSFACLWYWMFHLRREGFRLLHVRNER